jgi:O-antigen biosynthesis protein
MIKDNSRILFVLHERIIGGTSQTNRDLMQGIAATFTSFCLVCKAKKITLETYDQGDFIILETWKLLNPISMLELERDDYNTIVLEVLKKYRINLVHIRHLLRL